MWMEERFSHEGTCFSMPERDVMAFAGTERV